MATQRKTVQEIIESNKAIIAENNLKSWDEIHAFVLDQRTKVGVILCEFCGHRKTVFVTKIDEKDVPICKVCNQKWQLDVKAVA